MSLFARFRKKNLQLSDSKPKAPGRPRPLTPHAIVFFSQLLKVAFHGRSGSRRSKSEGGGERSCPADGRAPPTPAHRCALSARRRVLHRHAVLPVESVRHHPGQLSAPLRPQVPATTVLASQLLEAHVLGRAREGTPGCAHAWRAESKPLSVDLRPGTVRARRRGSGLLRSRGLAHAGGRRPRAPTGLSEPLAVHGGLNVTLKPRGPAKRLARASPCRLPYDLNFVVLC